MNMKEKLESLGRNSIGIPEDLYDLILRHSKF